MYYCLYIIYCNTFTLWLLTVYYFECTYQSFCQVLNVQNNKLKALPASIGNLRSLQSLNLQGWCWYNHMYMYVLLQ